MRLAGQARGGFYPAPPEAIALASSMLHASGPSALIDPCCGKGAAIAQIAATLSPHALVWAIELDEGRAAEARTVINTDEARFQCGGSFLATKTTLGTFSYAWVNPPYDDELGGGGRVEFAFLTRITGWLMPGGILQLAVPEHVTMNYDVQEYLLGRYDQLCQVPYPDGHRAYKEVIISGRKRKRPAETANQYWHDVVRLEPLVYEMPESTGPDVFEKSGYTDGELLEQMRKSRARRVLDETVDPPLPSPPLPLARGHIALLLAGGLLDAAVYPKGEPPHVVRGTAQKVQYISDQTEETDEDGRTTSKTIISERIKLVVRAVGPDGEIKTFAE